VAVAALTTADAGAQTPAPDPQGKVVAVTGKVEHTAAEREAWNRATVFQPLFVAERVRTLAASKAAILFIDESQVKLNAGAVLTVHTVRRAGGATTALELERGEGWFRTKNPRSGLTITTPAAAAAVRGTEINIVVRPDNETVLTVVEGSAEFSNAAGSILVNAGEEGTARPGQAPTKRVILNPENAVQWALCYPVDPSWRDLPAAALLAGGDVAGARRELDAALAADARALRPLVLLSTIELTQNHVDAAVAAATRALAVDQNFVPALVAASEAEQARFDLQAARRFLDKALQLDPRHVHALVNRARIRFGTGDTAGATVDANAAAAVAPDDAQVRSLRGFIKIADGDAAGARSDFEFAAQADTEFGEPHLGLGLVHFRGNRVNDGLLEMLTATLLEPHVSLYQSYLGKAYYQAQRFPEGLSALASAKRLDPRDPTPWLYTSLFLRDQNRQVDALNELRTAIDLNDRRAVYRGRLLLDRDLATKNVSLAEIYRQLGFEAWGAHEALNSLEADYTNASAHLFLAETYGLLPDRTQALGSELLQYFLHAPVNRNSFNNFSEYTSLLEQPRRQFDAEVETGTRDRTFGNVAHRSGNERFAHVVFAQASRQDGARPGNSDDRYQGLFQGKLSFTSSSDMFVSLSAARSERGQDDDTSRTLGLSGTHPVIVRQFVTPDPRVSTRIDLVEGTLGYRQQWRPGSSLTATARYTYLDHRLSNEAVREGCTGLPWEVLLGVPGLLSNTVTDDAFKGIDLQVQQATRLGRHQVIVGQRYFTQDKEQRCGEQVSLLGAAVFPFSTRIDGSDDAAVTYVRDEMQLHRRVHVTAGLAYAHMEYADFVSKQPEKSNQWSPLLGVSVRLTPATVLRAAAFRNLNTNVFGDKIAPPAVAGFAAERNELPAAERDEYNVSLETSRSRAFVAVRAFVRDTEVPYLLRRGGFLPDADARSVGTSAYLNLIVTPRVSLFADDQLVRFAGVAFDRYDNLLRAGVNVIHERGLFVRMSVSQVTQRFTDTTVTDLPRSTFAVADLNVAYEFAAKRGRLNFRVTNAFDEAFGVVLEGLSVDGLLPRRRALLTMRWRVF
jgi:tetratricopeptide (TPR) repeat protein